jgi:phosphatidylglycerol:prolipoprotein diacylglycerol transferase
MLPFLRIGPLVIQTPGLALLAGLWIASNLIEREALSLKLDAAAITKAISYALIGGIIGARLVFAAQHFGIYLPNPLGLLSLDTTTLDPAGGIVVGVAIAAIIGRREHLPLRPTLDALVPGLAVIMIALGLSHLLSGNAYGSPTHMPWGVELWGDFRHPTQIYETVAASLVLLLWRWKPPATPGSGLGFLQWLALQTTASIFLEAFRGDSLIWPGGFRAVQVVGLGILVVAIWLATAWRQTELG